MNYQNSISGCSQTDILILSVFISAPCRAIISGWNVVASFQGFD